jgi:hypothetical protein
MAHPCRAGIRGWELGIRVQHRKHRQPLRLNNRTLQKKNELYS